MEILVNARPPVIFLVYAIIIIIFSLRTKVFGFLRKQIVDGLFAQGIVNEVVNWSIRNRVKLNTDKCKELRISFTSDCYFPPVVIGEECIKLVKDAKLLGVTISGDLTWNAHITEVTKKAAKRLYFLVQLKRARVPSFTMLRQFSITRYQLTFRKN